MLCDLMWFTIAAVAAALPSIFVKNYLKSKNNGWILLAMISYLTLILAYTVVLADDRIAIIYPLLNAFNVSIVVGVGILVYKEKINTTEIMGIVLLMMAIYLLSRNHR